MSLPSDWTDRTAGRQNCYFEEAAPRRGGDVRHQLQEPASGRGARMKHRLADHLQSLGFRPNSQRVAVAVRPAPDGDGVFAILKVDRCIDLPQAEWIADKISADMRALLGAGSADEVVQKHCYLASDADGWTAAIGVELIDRSEADAVAAVLAAYADPGPGGTLN